MDVPHNTALFASASKVPPNDQLVVRFAAISALDAVPVTPVPESRIGKPNEDEDLMSLPESVNDPMLFGTQLSAILTSGTAPYMRTATTWSSKVQ